MGSATAIARRFARTRWARTAFGAVLAAFGVVQLLHMNRTGVATDAAAPTYCASRVSMSSHESP
jgi:hypothetical protein